MVSIEELKLFEKLIATAELRNSTFNASRERYIVEISYRAGIKEVVDWLMQENDKNSRILDGSFIIAKLNKERWQAKLKEWGIDTSLKV